MEEIIDQEQIWEEHYKWAKKHFNADIAKEPPNKKKISQTIGRVIKSSIYKMVSNGLYKLE